ncbi:LTR retrotransposon [Pseudoloma neurophilia]|uniref:RNA-directed DNA polymerase n=1 Tax=Pseudoloma neurophilia TaxID=146866 RepID=A0A0R0LUC3_9MICR|nr:LTR retrotransposon [Pseudoloma neurophilia]
MLEVIFDSGSSNSFMSNKTAADLGLNLKTVSQKSNLQVANGTTVPIEHEVVCSFKLIDCVSVFEQKFFVVNNFIDELILGLDFMSKNNVSIHLRDRIVKINGSSIKFSELNNSPDDELLNKVSCFQTEVQLNEMLDNFRHKMPFLGTIKNTVHKITLRRPDSEVKMASKPYQVPLGHLEGLNKIIKELLEMKVMRPSNSPICSPAFVVPKKNKQLRLVVDYRKLNSLTKPDRHPIPNLQEQLMCLRGFSVFSQLDLNSGYHQILIAEEDVHKTLFVIPHGQFEYLKMPFGLSNAPRTFQRAMNRLLGHLRFVRVYLDDILIMAENDEIHLSNIKSVFDILQENGISINFAKSTFFKKEVDYLGMKIDAEGIRPITEKLLKYENFKSPRTSRQLQQLLGFINWFRPFIRNLSDQVAGLYDILKKGNKRSGCINWTEKHTAIVKNIFCQIGKQQKLYYPDPNRPFSLYTDAFDIGLGSVLMQDEKPIGFFSRKLSETQIRYTVSEKEALAIIESLKYFRNIILCSQITIFTDHSNLQFLTSSKLQRVQRWKILMDEFDVDIRYLQATKKEAADFLSRNFRI